MTLIMNKLSVIIFLLILASSGCRLSISLTGASISPDVKTVSVQPFPNRAAIVQPSLSQIFTEGLKDKFVSQTSLELVNATGDLNFEGEITGYTTSPVSIQSNETASMNRLTISVHVKFTNEKDPKQNFDQTFSEYEDYESSKRLDEVEDELIRQITVKLFDDIFNKSAANW
jgi:hypothetical protein